ncbi:MAG: lysophospholipid acyltransferase family protein [Chromatiales bacterium]|nr:lysophospholipid acyltransferase family protein [Chromatiales bacterium]
MLAGLRSTLFYIGLALSTILFALLALLTFPLGFYGRYRIISQWTRFNIWWLGIACGLRYEVHGREHIPPGAAIVMSKHQSAWETLALQRFLPPQVWVLKKELMRIPFFGWGIGMLRPIAIDRRAGKRAMDQLVDQGRDRLDQGIWVVIFPEGTRVPPGQRGRYKPGGAILAARTGYPIVPIAHNAGEFWPKDSFIKRPGIIRVEIGPAVHSQGRSPEAIMQDVETWIEGRMVEISNVVGAGEPAA